MYTAKCQRCARVPHLCVCDDANQGARIQLQQPIAPARVPIPVPEVQEVHDLPPRRWVTADFINDLYLE